MTPMTPSPDLYLYFSFFALRVQLGVIGGGGVIPWNFFGGGGRGFWQDFLAKTLKLAFAVDWATAARRRDFGVTLVSPWCHRAQKSPARAIDYCSMDVLEKLFNR